MVVPDDESAGFTKGIIVGDRLVLRPDQIHRIIVEDQERGMQAGDYHVLIITGVGDHRRVI